MANKGQNAGARPVSFRPESIPGGVERIQEMTGVRPLYYNESAPQGIRQIDPGFSMQPQTMPTPESNLTNLQLLNSQIGALPMSTPLPSPASMNPSGGNQSVMRQTGMTNERPMDLSDRQMQRIDYLNNTGQRDRAALARQRFLSR